MVGTIRITVRGGSTGIEATQEAPLLCPARDGKILEMSLFPTRGDALAAAESEPIPE